MKNRYSPAYAALAALLMSAPAGLWAQAAQPTGQPPAKEPAKEEEVIVLTPFEVSSEAATGYAAASTLAGNRLNTELRDIGNAVSVITRELLKDIAATDNQTLLQYTTNTEVGSVFGNFVGGGNGSVVNESGNFTNPNNNTRIRGLTNAENTREYFISDIPWEGYNVDGVDLQRGPNSIMFGQGSPAGILNTRLRQASFKDSNEVSFRVGSWGSTRATLDINRVLLKNELAIRVSAVRNDDQYKQDPAYSLQKRLFSALRYEPRFLKNGSARTVFKADVEWGDINSNNPRQLPPIDAITPWFYTGTYQGRNVRGDTFTYNNLNRRSFYPLQNEDNNTGLPDHGTQTPTKAGPREFSGQPNEWYQPWVSRSLGQQFGNPAWNFDWNNSTQGPGIDWEPQGYGITSTGALGRSNSIAGVPYQRPAGLANYADFAQNARLPFYSSGVYRAKSLTDPSVFDFYNQLLDGPTKWEWQNFRAYNLKWVQTFLNDRLGFEAAYNNEWYKNGNVRLLSGDNQAISVDMNSVYPNGTPTGINGQSRADGTPNPNYGRPFVSDAWRGNNSYLSNREYRRLTVFGDYDFNENHRSWLTRLLGRHVLTGLLDAYQQKTDTRAWQRYGVDAAFEDLKNPSSDPTLRRAFSNDYTTPYTFIYLGPSLKDTTTATGANIPKPTVSPTIANGTVYTFDATWKPSTNPADPSYVNPGDYWRNDYYPLMNPARPDGLYTDSNGNTLPGPGVVGNNGRPYDSTQSENPANYVGFRNVPVTITDSETSQANRDALTTGARLTKYKLFSRAFNWQAHFWDKAVVVTFGVRKDIAKSWQYQLNTSSGTSLTPNYSRLDLSPGNYKLQEKPDNRLEVTSRAWTGVVHLNNLPYLKRMPIQVSLFYNKSTDFQPAANRVDIYGEPLAAPSGKTKDVGILLETNDGRYSLKVNKYTTDSVNQSSTAFRFPWFIGASQAWAANWVNRFEFNWTQDSQAGAVTNPDPNNFQYNYQPAPGESLSDAQAREASVIAAWRAWQQQVDPRFYAAWGINLNDRTRGVSASQPNGFTATEDSRSEGYEIEFNASPVRNWRVTLNASKSKAQRSNIGGTNLRAFVNAYVKALNNGAKGGVGDLRIWWGTAGNVTTTNLWYGDNQPFGSEFALRALQEGSDVPELRAWRANAITNYDFDRGWLKGFNVGGGVRYESSIIIGYKPIYLDPNLKNAQGAIDDSPANTTYDLANPYKGPAETYIDLWVGYRRRLWRNIDWNVQVNVRNAGVGNELIPITAEPDGSPATYRIKPPQQILLTNTFRF